MIDSQGESEARQLQTRSVFEGGDKMIYVSHEAFQSKTDPIS
jgi:hypothetical protein